VPGIQHADADPQEAGADWLYQPHPRSRRRAAGEGEPDRSRPASDSAAAALSPLRSEISPRRTLAPSADTAAADSSDRARPVTSCPAATSSGMMYEPIWPVPPVTKTLM